MIDRQRPLARLVICLALLVLGAVAAWRVPLSYLPSWSFPELNVSLRLPEAAELGHLTRTWIEPMESAIRAAGDVRSMAGEVDGQGGYLRVRFASGSAIETKAARLESELASLRRRLPSGSRLQVLPRSQGDGESSMILWLATGEGSERLDASLLDALRDLPQVSDLIVAGRSPDEIQVRSKSSGLSGASMRDALRQNLAVQRLGTMLVNGQRTVFEQRGGAELPFAEQRVRVGRAMLPLASVATVEMRRDDPSWVARRNGQRGRVLFVQRELDHSPLALERALLDTLRAQGVEAHFFVNEAEPLRRLLGRLLWGLLASVGVLAVGGTMLAGWRGALAYALALPVALAAALNALWLADVSLDLTTLPPMAIALAGCLGWLALRQGRRGIASWVCFAVSMTLLPIAVALASGPLAPLLQAPARAFLLTGLAASLALWAVPLPVLGRLPRRPWRRGLKYLQRRSGTLVLLVATGSYLTLVLTGSVLSPRPGNVPAALMDLAIFVQFAEGSTLAQAEAQVETMEQHLATVEDVEGYWSIFGRQGGTLGIVVRGGKVRLHQLRRLERRLQSELGHLGAAITVQSLAGGSRRSSEPLRFDDSIEDQARFDPEEAHTYRLILRSTDLDALRGTHERLVELLRSRHGFLWPNLVRSEWRRPTVRAELISRPGISRSEIARAAEAIRSLASPTPGRSLNAEGSLELQVLDLDAPTADDVVPQRRQLMGLHRPGEPLVASRYFRLREQIASPGILRQGGRFVLPVSSRIKGVMAGKRRDNVGYLHSRLDRFQPALGVDLELPDIGLRTLRRERLRLWAIGAALPLLMWTVGVCRLNGLVPAAACLVPSTMGLAAAAPWLLTGQRNIDEMTLLGLAAALVVLLPLAVEIAARLPLQGALAGGATYRWLARRLPMATLLLLGGAVLLAVPALGLEAGRHPWVMPLRGAAAVLVFGGLGSLLVLPSLLRALQRFSERDPQVEQELRRPAVWHHPGQMFLAGRHLTKVYGDGFKALHGLDFELRPGIIGLLGPNGAGKTTLLRLLCGLLEPSRGQIHFRGVPVTPQNLPEYRRLVGFLPQDFNAYEGMTAAQFLDYWALEKGIVDPRLRHFEIEKALSDVGLSDAAERRVRQFSGGMRRRIGIARALLGSPPIVIVDEPTTGLDVESRNRLRETLLSVAGERIIIFSTHIASDVAAAASRILLLHQGALLYDGSAEGLVERAAGRVFEATLSDAELGHFSHRYRVTTRVRTPQGIHVRAVTFGDQEPAGPWVTPNLEEAYLAWIAERTGRRGTSMRRAKSLLDLEFENNPGTTSAGASC